MTQEPVGAARNGPLEVRMSISASGPVPASLAWTRYERPELWPTWSPQLRSVRVAAGPDELVDAAAVDARLEVGLTGRAYGPLGVSVDFTVLEVDRGARRWTWLVRRGPIALRLEHTVEAVPDREGSRTTLVLHGPAPLVVGYLAPAWYALHRLVTI